jgi:hypothetical protein
MTLNVSEHTNNWSLFNFFRGSKQDAEIKEYKITLEN